MHADAFAILLPQFMIDPKTASAGPTPTAEISADLNARSGLREGAAKREVDVGAGSMTGAQRFLRACLRQPVDVTPVWFLRQAGRYMAEYQAVRRHHSLLEICRTPQLAAEVTITAAEKLDVDAAIIFADLLLPFTPMGLDFEFLTGEGPVVRHPVRASADIDRLRTDRVADLGYVGEAIQRVAGRFKDKLGIIGFCGAPYTLASYMIEGGGSRNWIETKSLMYRDPGAFAALLGKLVEVLVPYWQTAGGGRRGCHPDLRQLGRLAQRRGLSRIRSAAHHPTGTAHPGPRRAGHLLRRGHSKPVARHARDRRGCAWPRLAHSPAYGMEQRRPRMRRPRKPRPHHSVRAANTPARTRTQRSVSGRGASGAHL